MIDPVPSDIKKLAVDMIAAKSAAITRALINSFILLKNRKAALSASTKGTWSPLATIYRAPYPTNIQTNEAIAYVSPLIIPACLRSLGFLREYILFNIWGCPIKPTKKTTT